MRPTLRFTIAAPLALLALAAGCGPRAGGKTEYTPTAQTARQALETALNAWQEGKTLAKLAADVPNAHVVDSAWSKGEKLGGFEIVGENLAEGSQQFDVRLTMKTPPGRKEVRYYVVGREPMWVYRDDDYKRVIDMDGSPKEARPVRHY
jgi:hypothetical protein